MTRNVEDEIDLRASRLALPLEGLMTFPPARTAEEQSRSTSFGLSSLPRGRAGASPFSDRRRC